MKNFWKSYLLHNLWFHVLTFIAIALIVASWFVPPMAVIDGSVLAATGEIFAFAALGTVIKAIDRGQRATISHGTTSMTIGHGHMPHEMGMEEMDDGER